MDKKENPHQRGEDLERSLKFIRWNGFFIYICLLIIFVSLFWLRADISRLNSLLGSIFGLVEDIRDSVCKFNPGFDRTLELAKNILKLAL